MNKPSSSVMAGLVLTAVVVAGCGSSSSGGGSTPTASGGSTGTSPTSPPAGASTSSPPAGGGNQIAISGPFTAAATESSSESCATQDGAKQNDADATVLYSTSGTSGPAGSYELDIRYAPNGKTSAVPVPHPPISGGMSIRFSYQDPTAGGYLDWGYSPTPPPGKTKPAPSTATGTVTIAADGTSGSYHLSLPFTGDDAGDLKPGSKPAATIVGTFVCSG